MNITIHIENATPELLSALANLNAKTVKAPAQITHSVSVPKFYAPNGLKKDGTPAKKRGRPAGTIKQKGKA